MHTFLILGGTGTTGRRVAAAVEAAGHTARRAARGPDADVRFDWDDDATWAPAVDGAAGVYLVPPTLRLDHAPVVARFLERHARNLRVVALSARGVDADDAIPLRQVELALQQLVPDHTILRPTWFMQNFTEHFLVPRDGVVAAPTGDGAVPFVDALDIADVAVAALTEDGHAGRVYELSGPKALTFGEAAAALGARHVSPSAEEFLAGAVEAGVPAEYAQLLLAMLEGIAAGQEAALSTGVRDALGREPRPFADYVAREARPALARA